MRGMPPHRSTQPKKHREERGSGERERERERGRERIGLKYTLTQDGRAAGPSGSHSGFKHAQAYPNILHV